MQFDMHMKIQKCRGGFFKVCHIITSQILAYFLLFMLRVSSEAGTSEDEEADQGNNSYDDSFIDDRINPTATTQAESSRVDMMAIYRFLTVSHACTVLSILVRVPVTCILELIVSLN